MSILPVIEVITNTNRGPQPLWINRITEIYVQPQYVIGDINNTSRSPTTTQTQTLATQYDNTLIIVHNESMK
jgi:hypothetical protein